MIEASVLVVGAGAIGGVTAAKMTGTVRRVTVLDTNKEHVSWMRDPGLSLDELGEERHVQIEAHTDPSELDKEFDFALITLKAPHLEAALKPLHDLGIAKTFVSLGNGLVQDRIARIVGIQNMIVGTVEWGATNLGPGRLAQTTHAPFIIGEVDGSVRKRTRLLVNVLETVVEVRVTDNIRGQVWSKLLVNSTFSGLGVVSGLLYQEIADDPVGRETAALIIEHLCPGEYRTSDRLRRMTEGSYAYTGHVDYLHEVTNLVQPPLLRRYLSDPTSFCLQAGLDPSLPLERTR